MLVLVVTWEADQGKESEVISTFAKLAEGSRKEAGCRMYVVHRHVEEPRKFLVYEQYDNEAALQGHRDSAHFQQYALKELPALGKRIDADLYNEL